jgi:hypothetical protein
VRTALWHLGQLAVLVCLCAGWQWLKTSSQSESARAVSSDVARLQHLRDACHALDRASRLYHEACTAFDEARGHSEEATRLLEEALHLYEDPATAERAAVAAAEGRRLSALAARKEAEGHAKSEGAQREADAGNLARARAEPSEPDQVR